MDLLVRANRDLLDAELDLAVELANRVAIHENIVANLKEAEEIVNAKVRVGAAHTIEYLNIRAERLRAEIGLIREQPGQ